LEFHDEQDCHHSRGFASQHRRLRPGHTTTIKKEEGILGSQTTIERKTEPSTTSSTSVTTSTGSVGCTTETKQKTNEFGDTKTTKKTEC